MEKHLQWLIPLLLVFMTIFGEMWIMWKRVEALSNRGLHMIQFEQEVKDRLDILEKYCCEELKRCPNQN